MTDTLQHALYSIPADDRETWVTLAMAVKSALGEDGFGLWDAWSQQSSAYKAADAKAVWRSCKATGGITVASLYHFAKSYGWRGEAPTARQPEPATRRLEAAAEERKRHAAAERAAQTAEQLLLKAAYRTHPYLARKGFSDAKGLVLDDELIIPMRESHTNVLMGVQRIQEDGSKRFLAGSRVKGAVYRIGRGAMRWYCEGYATGLSVHAALTRLYRNDAVVVCFSANNLAYVARNGYVVADHDANGVGETYARRTGLPWWMPPEFGDANEVHQAHGVEALADELRGLLVSSQEASIA